MAYAVGHFEVRISQPQPPGYPLFVLEMRMVRWIHFRRAVRSAAVGRSLAALLLKYDQTGNAGYLTRAAAMAFLLAPVLIVNCAMFLLEGWYYKGQSTIGLAAAYEQVLSDLNSGMALTSLKHIKGSLAADDHSLRRAILLAAERPGMTVVVWERGLVVWRKAAYYLHGVPVVVLEHEKLRSGSPPVIAIWNGATLIRRIQVPAPLTATLPAGGRIVWLLNPLPISIRGLARVFRSPRRVRSTTPICPRETAHGR